MKPPMTADKRKRVTSGSDDASSTDEERQGITDASEWARIFCDTEPKELLKLLQDLAPYQKRALSEEFEAFRQGFVDFLLDEASQKDRIRQLSKTVFKFADTLAVTLPLVITKIKKIHSDAQKWNVFLFLRTIPAPNSRVYPLFEDKGVTIISSENRLALTEKCWLELVSLELPASLLRKSVPFLVDSLLPHMPNGQLFGDFLFKLFDRGQIFSVLSLAGIFHLIIHHNFEYPDFYSAVYSLLSTYVCYSTYSQRFLQLIDQFLRSSHVPNYVVAAYVKRLARILLTAPTPLQTPIVTLIRNVLSRHPDLSLLVHRDAPATLDADPFDEHERDLRKSNALESSLWELKAIRNHWHPSVAKKAAAAETVLRTELDTKWTTDEELSERMFARKFGKELPEIGEVDDKNKSSDEDEVQPQKKKAKGIAFVEMQRRLPAKKRGQNEVPVNFIEPQASFLKAFPQGAINYEAVWKA